MHSGGMLRRPENELNVRHEMFKPAGYRENPRNRLT
jgi:hypothetical protein